MAEGHRSEGVCSFRDDQCVICTLGFENERSITVTEKGMSNLISYSEKRGKSDLHTYLTECISKSPIGTVLVNPNCRRDFTDPKRGLRRNADGPIPSAKKMRSSFLPFTWKNTCMLCGRSAMPDSRHPERDPVHIVRTLPIRSNLLDHCTKRGDLWAYEVQNRLSGCIDLVAAEAVYHDSCCSRFMLNKEKSSAAMPTVKPKTQGRPQDQGMLQWFEKLCQWLEIEAGADLYTLTELHDKMIEFSGGTQVYTVKRLKQKLQEHYKEFIYFSEIEGRGNVLCFRNMVKYFVNEKWFSEEKK